MMVQSPTRLEPVFEIRIDGVPDHYIVGTDSARAFCESFNTTERITGHAEAIELDVASFRPVVKGGAT